MSERKTNKTASENKHGTLLEVLNRSNYLEHVRGNPTKNLSEAISYLYEELDVLDAYVCRGVSEEDIKSVRCFYETNNKTTDSDKKFDLMIQGLIKRREEGKIPDNYGICFVMNPDKNQFLVIAVPQRKT